MKVTIESTRVAISKFAPDPRPRTHNEGEADEQEAANLAEAVADAVDGFDTANSESIFSLRSHLLAELKRRDERSELHG